MSIGYPITKVDMDNRMGLMVVNLRAALLAPATFKAKFLDDATLGTDAFLQGLGYTGSGEIQSIRASFADLSKLNDIAAAAATQASANDFWFNAKHLVGLNV